MTNIHTMKTSETPQTPLLLFDCRLPNGSTEQWSTHEVVVDGQTYAARVLRHDALDMRSGGDDAIDAFSRVTVTLANADSYFSQIARNPGWKGAKVVVRFVFYDLKTDTAASDVKVVFRGVANPPDEISEKTIRLTFTSRMSLQRVLLPRVRIQRRCPWMFPSTAAQRADAVAGGERGEYSPFYSCGYSAGIDGGCGNLSQASNSHPATTPSQTASHAECSTRIRLGPRRDGSAASDSCRRPSR
jgi:hypothetical protein